MSSKRKDVYWRVDGSPSGSLGPLTNDAGRAQLHSTVKTPQIKKKTSRRSTLKTLCPEDKHKVRQLIEDLAKTGAEKDAIEQLLKKERHDFDEKLSQLHLEQQNLVEERTRLERSLHDSELQLQTIKSQNDQLVKAQSIPVLHSNSVGQWSRDHSAPPTKAINLDHSLNYLLLNSTNNNVQPPEQPSSSTSSSSLISSLHTADLTQQNHHPPSNAVDNAVPQSHPHTVSHSPAAFSDTVTQVKIAHTAVQTDHGNDPVVIPSVSSQSITAMTSSEFDNKMEHMMATALLNAKDTVNTIEAISQSLMMKSVSREASLMTIPLQQPLTSTQCVANNQGVANSQGVTNSQDMVNTHRMTTIHELTNYHNSQHDSNLMDARAPITPSGHTPRSQVDHVISSQQNNYTLYDSGHHEDTSLYLNRDDELQLEDLAETLNNSTLPMGWLQSQCFSGRASTSCERKNSNIAMSTQSVGEHLVIDHSDSDVINDLFFLQ